MDTLRQSQAAEEIYASEYTNILSRPSYYYPGDTRDVRNPVYYNVVVKAALSISCSCVLPSGMKPSDVFNAVVARFNRETPNPGKLHNRLPGNATALFSNNPNPKIILSGTISPWMHYVHLEQMCHALEKSADEIGYPGLHVAITDFCSSNWVGCFDSATSVDRSRLIKDNTEVHPNPCFSGMDCRVEQKTTTTRLVVFETGHHLQVGIKNPSEIRANLRRGFAITKKAATKCKTMPSVAKTEFGREN